MRNSLTKLIVRRARVAASLAVLAACRADGEPPAPAKAGSSSVATEPGFGTSRVTAPRARRPLHVLLGGDMDFGRLRGDRLTREPSRNDFAPLAKLFATADLRFANLESTLSSQFAASRVTPRPLVFTGPVAAADVLARAPLDVVSVANNHAWDFEEPALLESLEVLARVGVKTVGAGRSRDEAFAPRIVEVDGWRIAFVAATSTWNQADAPHPGRERIADADDERIERAIEEARTLGADRVIVSHHGGSEYESEPSRGQRAFARRALAAGADIVVGHHAHVVQPVARIDGRTVFYGLGNLLMRMVTAHPETEFGALAKVTFEETQTTSALCPVQARGLDIRLAAEDAIDGPDGQRFRRWFSGLQRSRVEIGEEVRPSLDRYDAAGCAALREP